jgi:two-component system, OmpR family, osmolarity sensor histidine kinase EnvZ
MLRRWRTATCPFLPSSLYGRAALILVVPIVTIQLLVSVAFIQRHFEGVTEQMSAGVVLELQLLLGDAAADPARAEQVAQSLGLTVRPADDTAVKDSRDFWDFSGRVVMRVLHDGLPEVQGVDLVRYHRQVLVRVAGPAGDLDIGS